MDSLEIYFSDLVKDAQTKVLKFYNLATPDDGNLDIVPIAILDVEDMDDYEGMDVLLDDIDIEDGESLIGD